MKISPNKSNLNRNNENNSIIYIQHLWYLHVVGPTLGYGHGPPGSLFIFIILDYKERKIKKMDRLFVDKVWVQIILKKRILT